MPCPSGWPGKAPDGGRQKWEGQPSTSTPVCQRCTRSRNAVWRIFPPGDRHTNGSACSRTPRAMRRVLSTTRCFRVRLLTVPLDRSGQTRQRALPTSSADVTVSRKARRMLPGDALQPSVNRSSGRRAGAVRQTWGSNASASVWSRRTLTVPASQRRIETLMAHPIHAPLFRPFTRIASAGTGTRSTWRCSTSAAGTLWPCEPARSCHYAMVRSSYPKACTSACLGHPEARTVPPMTIRPRGVRSPSNRVPRLALQVGVQTFHRSRCRLRSGMVIVLAPLLPLAQHASFGHRGIDVSSGSVVVGIHNRMPMDADCFPSPESFTGSCGSTRSMVSIFLDIHPFALVCSQICRNAPLSQNHVFLRVCAPSHLEA